MRAQGVADDVEGLALDRFRERSDRFLFASRRDGAGLVYLEQGTANQQRAYARQHLRCPEPNCTSPDITTVSRSATGARDGYRHLVRPETQHAPEGLFHRQAKAMVARWAFAHPAVAQVQEEVLLGAGERVADVLLTSHTGNRLVIEVQYASLSIEAWRERTESYHSLGVEVVWLWGHTGAHSPLELRWRAIGLELARVPAPVLWINPTEDRVAWAFDMGALDQPVRDPGMPHYTLGTLDDLDLRQTGLYPPGFLAARDLAIAEAERSRARSAEIQKEKAEQAARLHARRAEADGRRAQHRPTAVKTEATRAKRLAHIARKRAEKQAPQRERTYLVLDEPESFCRRCGLPLDPVLAPSGYHVDPLCHQG
ncbi:competence protein CoiA family protein [Nocardioides cheoyonin]|uniref:competence protein CoiA family protein n=1 Tax=Nocardioides cheoyonin TaxID=3156615 RepID=UPI0032B5EBDF